MEIESLADVKLVGRAMREGWIKDPAKKDQAVAKLMEVMELGDPKMTIEAFRALVRADEADLKRAELEEKVRQYDDQQRLRILEFFRSIGSEETRRIASEGGITLEAGEVGREEIRS